MKVAFYGVDIIELKGFLSFSVPELGILHEAEKLKYSESPIAISNLNPLMKSTLPVTVITELRRCSKGGT